MVSWMACTTSSYVLLPTPVGERGAVAGFGEVVANEKAFRLLSKPVGASRNSSGLPGRHRTMQGPARPGGLTLPKKT